MLLFLRRWNRSILKNYVETPISLIFLPLTELAMPFPNWRKALLAHPAEAASNRNNAKFLAAFCKGSSAATRTTALAEDEHALILAHSPGVSKLCLYGNFVNFGGRRTCPGAKLAVLHREQKSPLFYKIW